MEEKATYVDNLSHVIITEMHKDSMLGEVRDCCVNIKYFQSPNPALCHR